MFELALGAAFLLGGVAALAYLLRKSRTYVPVLAKCVSHKVSEGGYGGVKRFGVFEFAINGKQYTVVDKFAHSRKAEDLCVGALYEMRVNPADPETFLSPFWQYQAGYAIAFVIIGLIMIVLAAVFLV